MRKVLVSVFIIMFFTVTHADVVMQDSIPEIVITTDRQTVIEHSSAPRSGVYLKQMESEQRQSMHEIAQFTPSLYVPEYGSRMTSTIYMRGLGSRIDNPVLGVYVDGVGIANKNAYDFLFYDLRALQVFRGPQGTLFGRNTIGGVMTIETLSPLSFDGTRATLGYSNYNTAQAHVSHYHRFNSHHGQMGISATAFYRHSDGYFTNLYDGSRADKGNEAGARLRFDMKSNDGLAITAFVSYNMTMQNGFPYHQPQMPINHNDTCSYARHNLISGLTVKKQMQDYVLSSTTSYQYLQDDMHMDQDYMPLPYFTLRQAQNEHYVSEELTFRPKSKFEFGDGYKWNWLTGLSIAYKHNRMLAPVTFKQAGIDSLILKNANMGSTSMALEIQEPQFVIDDNFTQQTADMALYHTSYLDMHDFRLEAGLRLNYEYLHFRYLSKSLIHARLVWLATGVAQDYVPILTQLEGQQHLSYFEALPRIALTYRPTEKNNFSYSLSASISEGYKAGGFNSQLFSDILQKQMQHNMTSFTDNEYDVNSTITYKPEHCLSSEVGANISYHRHDVYLQSSLSIYEMEVFNQQLTVFPPYGTGRYMTNAGRSRNTGTEMLATFRWKNLDINVSYSYVHAAFVRYQSGTDDFAGNIVPFVPQHTISGGITYTQPLNHKFFHSIMFNLNTTALGKIYWNEQNTEQQPFYALLNGNINLNMKYVSLALWAKNLTNTHYDVFRFVSMGNTFMQSGRPITFGATLNFEI